MLYLPLIKFRRFLSFQEVISLIDEHPGPRNLIVGAFIARLFGQFAILHDHTSR